MAKGEGQDDCLYGPAGNPLQPPRLYMTWAEDGAGHKYGHFNLLVPNRHGDIYLKSSDRVRCPGGSVLFLGDSLANLEVDDVADDQDCSAPAGQGQGGASRNSEVEQGLPAMRPRSYGIVSFMLIRRATGHAVRGSGLQIRSKPGHEVWGSGLIHSIFLASSFGCAWRICARAI